MSLSGWNKNNILKFSIDYTKVDEDLYNFPVLINLTEESGQNDFDCSDVFNQLNITNNGTITDEFDFFDTTKWYTCSNGCSIINGKLKLEGNDYKEYKSKYKLKGDFDVRVDLEVDTGPATDSWSLEIKILFTNTDEMAMTRRYDGSHKYLACYKTNDAWHDLTSYSTGDTSCKLRIKRENTLYTFYYWNGSSWTTVDSLNYNTSEECYAIISHSTWNNNPTAVGLFDNFNLEYTYLLWDANAHPNSKKIAMVYPSVQEHWIESVDDDFTGNDGDEPNELLWDNSSSSFDLYDNKLRITKNISNAWYPMYSVYKLQGDCSVEIYVEAVTLNSSNKESAELQLFIDNNNFVLINIHDYNDSPRLRVDSKQNGSWAGNTLYDITQYNVYLKLTRQGSSITGSFSFDHTTWTDITTITYSTFSNDVKVIIGMYVTTGTPLTYVDNFKLIYGSIDWDNNTPRKVLKSYIHGEQEQLFCEIERWDHPNKSAQLWIKVPRVLSDQPTDIYLYYDKEQEDNDYYVGYTSSTPAQKVWDDNFMAVYHLSQDPSGGVGCILDSTSNKNNGTPYGNTTSSDLVDMSVGKGLDFDGSDYIALPDNSNFKPDFVTVETYIKARDTDDYGRVFDRYHHPDYGYGCGINPDGRIDAYIRLEGSEYHGASGYIIENDNKFHTYSFKVAIDTIRGYCDGALTSIQENTNNKHLVHEATEEPRIGDGYYDNNFNGIIGTIRISNIARSDAWILSTHKTITDKLTFVTKANIYMYSGYVKELGKPVQREVFLYDRASGELIDKTTSNINGYYLLKTTSSGIHNIVCLDAEADPNFNDLIISKVEPNGVI